ncbi:MAG: hypothetical protein KQJ78_23845 [Deltaproteobacteria bacterium]|nr:hypothetical protein [Deltaproteobacteria bacterium]
MRLHRAGWWGPGARRNLFYGALVSALLLWGALGSGCALVELNQEVKQSLESTVLVGYVSADVPGEGPVIVAAYTKRKGEIRVASYVTLCDSGEFEIMVEAGEYYLFAFRDENRNFVYDPQEPAGQYGGPKKITAPAGGTVLDIYFALRAPPAKIDFPLGQAVAAVKPVKCYYREAGTIVQLNDDLFSEANGEKGFWTPVKFFKEIGGSIYFLEEYDPKKIPILFVHGTAGTPRNWSYLVERLDKKRFQPWFFYYPTGARLESMSYLLFWKMYNLKRKYKFDTLYITAHSMGGLVVRSFIINYGEYISGIKLFVAFATPWGGDALAEYGVSQSPAVIPSWIDMMPNGEFINSLYRKNIPGDLAFYMFSAFKGSRNPFAANNDGTLALSSTLDFRPQAEAKMNYAFNEDHNSIMYSKEVSDQYNIVLDSLRSREAGSPVVRGGYLRVSYEFDYPSEEMRPAPYLLLRPRDKGKSAMLLYLSGEDSGKQLGPFPPGDYGVHLGAAAVKPDQDMILVTISENKSEDVSFVFSPDGVVTGYVTAALKSEDKPMGMPADKYMLEEGKIVLESVTLRGQNIARVLHPVEIGDVNNNEYIFSRRDFCARGYFIFYGLPAGEYELTIKAKGFQPLTEKRTVVPGRQLLFKNSELMPVAGGGGE